MAVVEVIYVAAASLWILVVLAALATGCYLTMRFRRSRRRMNRLFGVVGVPVQFGVHGVWLLRRCEDTARSYGAAARGIVAIVAPQLQMLAGELRSDRRPVPSPRGRRR